MTQPTVSKYWRKKLQKTNQTMKTTKYTYAQTIVETQKDIHKISTTSPLVYNNLWWLGDGSHRGQGRQAWTAVGLPSLRDDHWEWDSNSHWESHGNGNWWHNWEWEGMGIILYAIGNDPYYHGNKFPSADAVFIAYVIVTYSLLYNGNSL